VCAAVLTVALTFATGQDPAASIHVRPHPPTARSYAPILRLDLKLVLVPITVTDATDRPVTNLTRDRFRVLEDGVEQSIRTFSEEDDPVSLGLLFDSSGSMKGRLAASLESMRLLFLRQMAGDEYFVVQFADGPHLLGGFTQEPAEIQQQLGTVQAHGWTSLLDAMALGVHQMQFARNRRRVLLILSDGADNHSRYTETEVRDMVMEGDVRVYAIALAHRPKLLQQLAAETGGRVLLAANVGELPDVVDRLSRDIRSQYVVGYSSTNPLNDGKYHKVTVELVTPPGAPPLHASWRHGYFAPAE
jgi:Ca-activated chloride channel homolog